MEKKQPQAKQKRAYLRLQKETLRHLADSKLRSVAGGGYRLRVPIGYLDDSTPIYDDTTG